MCFEHRRILVGVCDVGDTGMVGDSQSSLKAAVWIGGIKGKGGANV